jgi:hypothetical protein
MREHNAPTPTTLTTKATDEPRFGRMESIVAAKGARNTERNAHGDIVIADVVVKTNKDLQMNLMSLKTKLCRWIARSI